VVVTVTVFCRALLFPLWVVVVEEEGAASSALVLPTMKPSA